MFYKQPTFLLHKQLLGGNKDTETPWAEMMAIQESTVTLTDWYFYTGLHSRHSQDIHNFNSHSQNCGEPQTTTKQAWH